MGARIMIEFLEKLQNLIVSIKEGENKIIEEIVNIYGELVSFENVNGIKKFDKYKNVYKRWFKYKLFLI